MALTDNIIAMVIIVFVAIIIFTLTTHQLAKNEATTIEQQQSQQATDYQATLINTFLALNQPGTQKTFALAIGDYINSGEHNSLADQQTLEDGMAKALNGLIGQHGYYFKVEPTFTNLTLSFVIDTSESLSDERAELADKLDELLGEVLADLKDQGWSEDTVISARIYLLGTDLCDEFKDVQATCKVLDFNDLYQEGITPIPPPSFAYTSYAAWQAHDPQAKIIDFLRSDWMAGMSYAVLDHESQQYGKRLHIIIPLADELSTGSDSDACYGISATDTAAAVDYNFCAHCDNTCPIDRSNRSMSDFLQFVDDAQMNTVIIPIVSFDCSYPYPKEKLNDFYTGSTYLENYLPASCLDTTITACAGADALLCDDSLFPSCTGCSCSSTGCDEHNLCLHPNCVNAVKDQMDFLAKKTGGYLIDIQNLPELKDILKSSISNAIKKKSLEVGELDNTRTRSGYERDLVLPNKKEATISLLVYDDPFTDNTTWQGPTATPVTITIISPKNNSVIYNQDPIDISIHTDHEATCYALDTPDQDPATGTKLATTNNHLHTFSIPFAAGEQTSYYWCNGTSDAYAPAIAKHVFTMQTASCTELGGNEICDSTSYCFGNDYVDGYPGCCKSSCITCADVGGITCSESEGCTNWNPDLPGCCMNTVCGTCENQGYTTCTQGTSCDGTLQTAYGDQCCAGDCKTCDERGYQTCADNQGCDGTLQAAFGNACCDGTCQTCDDMNYQTCASNEGCDGTWAQGFGDRCCAGDCKTCEEAGGSVCGTGETCPLGLTTASGCCEVACVPDDATSFDLRHIQDNQGNLLDYTTPARDQGTCGSCWSFASVGAAETALNIKANDPTQDLDLSEENLINKGTDCCTLPGCGTCSGGSLVPPNTYISTTGIVEEQYYSYTFANYVKSDPSSAACADLSSYTRYKTRSVTVLNAGWANTTSKIQTIKRALIKYGPIVTGMEGNTNYVQDSQGNTLQPYNLYAGTCNEIGMVYYNCDDLTNTNTCKNHDLMFYDYAVAHKINFKIAYISPYVDHAVVIVGYDSTGWIIKNSWGTHAGNQGFMHVNYGECFIPYTPTLVEG